MRNVFIGSLAIAGALLATTALGDGIQPAARPQINLTNGLEDAQCPLITVADGIQPAARPQINQTNGLEDTQRPLVTLADGIQPAARPQIAIA